MSSNSDSRSEPPAVLTKYRKRMKKIIIEGKEPILFFFNMAQLN